MHPLRDNAHRGQTGRTPWVASVASFRSSTSDADRHPEPSHHALSSRFRSAELEKWGQGMGRMHGCDSVRDPLTVRKENNRLLDLISHGPGAAAAGRRRRRRRRNADRAGRERRGGALVGLGQGRAVRERRQLEHQHRQRLLRRPAVQRQHLARLRRQRLRASASREQQIAVAERVLAAPGLGRVAGVLAQGRGHRLRVVARRRRPRRPLRRPRRSPPPKAARRSPPRPRPAATP